MNQNLKNLLEETSLSLEEKIDFFKKKFESTTSPEGKYQVLIGLGRSLPPFKETNKVEKYLVRGCQSKLYLYSYALQGKIFFEVTADALISAGLAALLAGIYSGEAPEILLKHSPDFLHELGIYASLSPNRSNGLSALHLRMQQDALHLLINN